MAITDSFEGRTCFIAAPIDTEVSGVVSSLVRRGIRCHRADWFEMEVGPTSLKNAIKDVDFVCVFSPAVPPANLFFEVGIAIGLGKPLFIVAQHDFLLHSGLRLASFVSAAEWKADVVDPHLDAFLNTLPARRSSESRKKHRTSKRLDFAGERREMESLAKKPEGSYLESFVENLFRKAGLNVTKAPLEDFGADMAVWSPAIRRKFGDPILVEVKLSSPAMDHRSGIEKLSELIRKGRGSAGVYVTLASVEQDPALRKWISERRAPILLITVTNLIDSLENNRFADELWAARNRIHGHGM